eukprot:COSAG02_NODE_8585_length_2513_cov_15.886081_4_plen_71_part_01
MVLFGRRNSLCDGWRKMLIKQHLAASVTSCAALRKLSSLRSSSGVALLIFGDAGAAVSNAAPERVRLVPSP